MNGMDGSELVTIHVTPEAGFSYASCEMHAATGLFCSAAAAVQAIVAIFQPRRFVVACTSAHAAPGTTGTASALNVQLGTDSLAARHGRHATADALGVPGYACLGSTEAALAGSGAVVHLAFERSEAE